MTTYSAKRLPQELVYIIQDTLTCSSRPNVTRAFVNPSVYRFRSHIPSLAASSTSHPQFAPSRIPSRSFSTSRTLHHDPNHTSNSSVDPREVSHFNALASSWWDPYGPSRILHLMNPIRHQFIQSCLASQVEDASPSSPSGTRRKLHYLDVGCGGGIFAESAARLANAASVTGVDPSPEVLKVAEAHRQKDPSLLLSSSKNASPSSSRDSSGGSAHNLPAPLRYLNSSIEDLPSSLSRAGVPPPNGGEGYDVVTLFEVIEHVSNPSAFLAQCASHVRPGGWLVLSTIARTWTSWFVTKLMAEDVLRIVPRGTHEWNKYINEAELRGWFAKEGGWSSPRAMGVMYVPGVGWKEVKGGEDLGNYFFAVRKDL